MKVMALKSLMLINTLLSCTQIRIFAVGLYYVHWLNELFTEEISVCGKMGQQDAVYIEG